MTQSASEVLVLDPLTRPDWNDLLLAQEKSTIFHSSNWARVITHSYDFKPIYFTLFKGGNFRGCIPIMDVDSLLTSRRGVSLSFSDYCGSLAERHADFQKLFESILSFGRKCGWRFGRQNRVSPRHRTVCLVSRADPFAIPDECSRCLGTKKR